MREAGESVSSAGPRSGRSRGESGKGGSRTDCNVRWEYCCKFQSGQPRDLIAVSKACTGSCMERKFKVKGVNLTTIQPKKSFLTPVLGI